MPWRLLDESLKELQQQIGVLGGGLKRLAVGLGT